MREMTLRVGGRETRILIGNGILDGLGAAVNDANPSGRVAVVTNPTVDRLYGDRVRQSLDRAGLTHSTVEVPDAESAKSLDTVGMVCSRLSSQGFDRDSTVIGLGGGAVGDIAGFAAATYMRGVRLVQAPTTLLAQVDSAIGGKAGVNLPEGKNLVGAYHQPSTVVSDVLAVRTLSEREFRSGVAEVVKCWVVSGEADFHGIRDEEWQGLPGRRPELVEEFVARCNALKARLVEGDERDQGARMGLNLGHTLGHALEAATGYGRYTHGEAVSIGIAFAARLSVARGTMSRADAERIESMLEGFRLPLHIERDLDSSVLVGLMRADKKSRGGRLRLVLPVRIGEFIVDDVDGTVALEILKEMMG